MGLADLSGAAGGRLVVDGVTLEVTPGGTLGLVGPNGSGKSSLLRLVARLRRAAGGTVVLGGEDLASLPRRVLARRVALVEQQASTEVQLTVEGVVRLGRTPHLGPLAPPGAADTAAVEAALAEVGMAGRRHQPWHTLSGGERQRVHVARALAQGPQLFLLDEPTNHLDIRHQLEILALVRRLPATAIVALHDLNLAALFCDAIAVLREGRLVAAGPPEAVLTEALIADVFGVRARVAPSPDHGRPHVHYLPAEGPSRSGAAARRAQPTSTAASMDAAGTDDPRLAGRRPSCD